MKDEILEYICTHVTEWPDDAYVVRLDNDSEICFEGGDTYADFYPEDKFTGVFIPRNFGWNIGVDYTHSQWQQGRVELLVKQNKLKEENIVLKLEDLEVGDVLEFIDAKAKKAFIEEHEEVNLGIADLFTPTNIIEASNGDSITMQGTLENGHYNLIYNDELKYFRKVSSPKVEPSPEVVASTKLVNAGLESTTEMYTRMLAGEVFHFEGSTFKFNGTHFRVVFSNDTSSILTNVFTDYKDFQVKVESHWYDNASEENPILCKVWDSNEDSCRYDLVYNHRSTDNYPYKTDGEDYKHATPVLPSECYQGEA